MSSRATVCAWLGLGRFQKRKRPVGACGDAAPGTAAMRRDPGVGLTARSLDLTAASAAAALQVRTLISTSEGALDALAVGHEIVAVALVLARRQLWTA